jgi:hypothetical protein
MASKRTYNDLTEETYLRAINWLEDGGTKKGACEILKVSSNPTMERLILEFHEGKVRDREMRAAKRKVAVTQDEVLLYIMDYINGCTLNELSDRHFRSIDTIKMHLEKHGAMLRFHGTIDQLNPPMLPDECVSETFDVGQYVWSAKYGCIAQVKSKYKNAWKILVLGEGLQEYAYQEAAQLGSLKHIEALGVNLAAFEDYMPGEEVRLRINETMREANKRHAKDGKK